MKLMKYIVGCLVVTMLFGGAFAFAQTATVPAKPSEGANVKLFAIPPQKGQKSDEVRDLQRILSTNPSVYPDGLVTGYFGPITEAAIKRLQVQYGLPATGIVDEATQWVLFPPQIKLTVVSPNGGEVWDRSNVQTITWQTWSGPVSVQNREVFPAMGSMKIGGGVSGEVMPSIYPLFHQASLDLVRDSNPSYVYHIGTVDLYQSSRVWSIPQDVAAGNDFRIRISVGGHVPCMWAQNSMPMDENARACPAYHPIYSVSDTSDGTFTISGSVVPNSDVISKLKAQVNEMEATLMMLMRQIQAMKEQLARL